MNGTGMRILKWGLVVVLGKCGFDIWAGSLEPGPERWRSVAMELAGHPGPRYLDVSVDLTVEGASLTVSRVIACLPYFYHQLGNTFLPTSVPARQAITHRLPNGGGIIVVIPLAQCSGAKRLPDDYVPLTAWVDNADDPTVIEAYFSGTLVRSPEARVRFHAMRIRNIADLEAIESPDEFGWWRNLEAAGYKQDRSVPADWFAVFGRVVERPQWQASPVLAELFAHAAGPQVLTNNAADSARDIAPVIFPTVEIIRGQAQDDQQRVRFGPEDKFLDVVPLRRIGNALTPSEEERGTIVFYRISDLMQADVLQSGSTKLFPPLIANYSLSGRTIGTEVSASLFDPTSERLIRLTHMYLRFLTQSE